MQDSLREKLREVAEAKLPEGEAADLRARLEGMGYKPRKTLSDEQRDRMTWQQRAVANTYNPLRAAFESTLEIGAAPTEALGQVTGSDTLRSAAQGIRDIATINEDAFMAPDGRRLVEPGFGSLAAGGGGSALGFMLGGAAMRGLGAAANAVGGATRAGAALSTTANVALGTTVTGNAARLGSIVGAQSQYRDAEAHGATEAQKWGAFWLGAGIGVTEAASIGGTGRITGIGEVLAKINQRSGGALQKAAMGIPTVLKEGGKEAAQEGFQTFSELMVAQQIVKYADPEELEAIIEHTVVGAGIGAIVGGGLAQLGVMRQGRQSKRGAAALNAEAARVGEDVLGNVEAASDPSDAERVQATPEEAAERYFTSAGVEPSEYAVIQPDESREGGDEEAQQKAQETAEKYPELVGLLETIKGDSERTVPPVVVVEKGSPKQPAAYIDGVVVIDGSRVGEVQARLAMHELLHGRARVGSQGYTQLVEAAKAEFPGVAAKLATWYADDFVRATGREPFAAIQDPALREAKLVEEGFAWAAENMQQVVSRLIQNPRAFATDPEARGWVASIWDWIKGLVGKGSKGLRKETIATLNRYTSDNIRVGENLQPEEVLAVSRAIADVFRNVDQEVLRSVPFEETLPTVGPEAAPATVREAEPEVTEEDQAMADAVDVEAIAAEVDAEAEPARAEQPKSGPGGATSAAPVRDDIDPSLTPKQRKRLKQKRNRQRKREGKTQPTGPDRTYRRDDTMSAAEDAIERFERGDERWAVAISPGDARKILKDIETGRGRIDALVERKPAIREFSIESVRQRVGERPDMYHFISPFSEDELRQADGAASASLTLDGVMAVADMTPALILGRETSKTRTPTLRLYAPEVERVIADVPTLAVTAASKVGKRVRTDRSGMMDVADIVDTALNEQEVRVDLSGLEPVAEMPLNTITRTVLAELRENRWHSPQSLIAALADKHSTYLGLERNPLRVNEAEAKREAEELLGQVVPFVRAPKGDIPMFAVAPSGDAEELLSNPYSFNAILGKPEAYDVKKSKAGGRSSVRDMGLAAERRARKNGYRVKDPKSLTEEEVQRVSEIMASEVAHQVGRDSSAVGWYSRSLRAAFRVLAKSYPELAKDSAERRVFLPILAVTSNGQNVYANFAAALDIYTKYRETGVIPSNGAFGGERQAAIRKALKLVQGLIDSLGVDGMHDFLVSRRPVRELKAMGYKINDAADYEAPGAIIFGPKLGSFHANLSGFYDMLTADLWFSRTYNRYLGHARAWTPASKERKRQNLIEALKGIKGPRARRFFRERGFQKGVVLRERRALDALARVMEKELGDAGFKVGRLTSDPAEANAYVKANGLVKELREPMWIAPRNISERVRMREVARRAQKILAEAGVDIEISDMQAVLWYYEKELYAEHGAANEVAEGADYADAARVAVANLSARHGVERGGAAGRGGATGQQPKGGPSARGEDRFAAASPTIEVDGVERPRLNSEGKPIAGTDDALRSFWKWFGESKVVDEQGRPLVVYHGTGAEFTEYESGRPAFFTQSARYASERSRARSGAPNVMPVYLAVSNPLSSELRKGEFSVPKFEERVFGRAREQGRDGAIVDARPPAMARMLRAMGYEVSIRDDQGLPERYFVAFRPEQVKSALGNRGTFSPEEGDIRWAVAPAWDTPEWEAMRRRIHGILRDEDGNPRVLYHATRYGEHSYYEQDERGRSVKKSYRVDPFTEFRPGGVLGDVSGRGIWLAVDPDLTEAGHNTRGRGDAGDAMLPVYADISRPLIIDDGVSEEHGDSHAQWIRSMEEFGPNFPRILRPEAPGAIEDMGHDGVVLVRDGEVLEVVALHPNQVKSIWNKRPTSDPDMRFAVAPEESDIPLANLGKGLVGKGVRAKQKYLTSRGLLPQSAFDAMIEERDSRVAVANQRIKNVAQDWRRAVKKLEGGLDEVILGNVDAALRGQYPFEALPEPLRDVTRRMRDEVDELSKALISSGAVEGDVIATVRANMGLYLTRTYRAFTDPKWMEKVPEEVKNWAKAYIRKQFEKRDRDTVKILEARAELAAARAEEARVNARTARRPERHIDRAERYEAVAEKYAKRAREFQPTPVDLEAEVLGILEDAKRGGSPLGVLSKGKLGAKNLSILKRRKRIAPEIRALLGEETDPLVNYAQSAMKMAHLIANHEFLARVRAAGLDEGFFSKTRQGDNVVEIAAEASEVMRPLNGLYTSPDVLEAFSDVFDPAQIGRIMRVYFKVNAAVKAGKTAGSWATQARNIIGGPFFLLSQGNLTPQFVGKAFGGFLAGMGWSTAPGRRAYIESALKYGVIHESAQAGELKDIMRDATGVDHLYNPLKERGLLKRGFRVVLELYQAADDFYKLIAWEAEKASLRKTNPEMTEDEVNARAAHIVRVTNPTYSLVPRGVKAFRRNPLSGPFTSFPAEMVRISWNTGHLIKEELSDPKRRKRGLRRLAGALASATLVKGIQMGTAFLMGYTDDDEEAMRHFAPEYSKNGDWAYLGEDSEGRPRYVDLSYTDPFSYLKGVVNAAFRGEDIADGLADSVVEALEPFFGEELLAGALMDLRANQTPYGGEIYNEAEPWHKTGEDWAGYLWENAFEPGTLTSLRRIQKALNGEVSQGGKAYNTADEVAAMVLGQRRSAIDVEQSLTFIALDYSSGISKSNKILSSAASRRGEVTDDEIRSAYEGMEAARRRTFDEALKAIRYARRLELTDDVIEARLRGAGISEAQTKALLKGEYEPYNVTGQFLRFYERGADAERKKELRERRKFVKSLSQDRE